MFDRTRPETDPVYRSDGANIVGQKHSVHHATHHLGYVLVAVLVLTVSSSAHAQDEVGADDAFDGEPVSLERLLDYADKNAPDVQLAHERTELGRAAVDGARIVQPHNPELEGEIGVGIDEPGVRRAEVTLRQRLEVAGQRGLRIDAARQRQNALDAELDAARRDVHQRIHRLYRQALIDRKQVEVEQSSLAFTRRLHQIAKQRFDAGEAARTSVIIANAEVARAKQRSVQSQMDYEQTARELGTIVGWDKQSTPTPVGELNQATPAPDPETLLGRASDSPETSMTSSVSSSRRSTAYRFVSPTSPSSRKAARSDAAP